MTAVREAPLIPGYSGLVEIGSGGFATVYRARREAFDQTVAVKVVHLGGAPESVRMRFDRERRALGSLAHHPHIVTVYDGGITSSGAPFLVMEYLPDGSLEKQAGRLSTTEVLRIGVQLAGALETAHRSNVLHRDVKPANVLRSRYGDPVLADFGIARLAGGSRTTSGVVTASLAYAPPEVLEAKQPGPEADVWSLAATLVCLLTGRPPFAVEVGDAGTPALIARILRDEPPDLVGQGVPADVAVPLLAAMANDPRRRVGSALELAESLRDVQRARGETVTAAVVDGVSQRSIVTEQPRAVLPFVLPSPASAPWVSNDRPLPTVPFRQPVEHDLAERGGGSERSRPWWRPPLVVTLALAATTLVGAVMIEIFVGVGSSPDAPRQEGAVAGTSESSSITSTPSPVIPPVFPPELSGTWNGFVALGDGSGTTYEQIVTFTAGSGTARVRSEDIRYGRGESGPELQCTGRWELRGRDATGTMSIVEMTESGDCASDVPVTLSTKPESDSLRMLSEGPAWTDTATFGRADVPPAR